MTNRLTIDFGIDLGTTNSSVAVLDKNGPRNLRNNDNWQFTPSAVWVEKNGAIRVGMSAKERVFSDPENGSVEFKLMMGRDYVKRMERLNRSLKPEELSAEILKSLKTDVQRETGEDLDAAVITVPAAFDLPESEATGRAAKLAGITLSPLLQEPVAAALAYSFQREQENVFWLVYDLGGGTFDAAVIQVRDGIIQVVNHGGDNTLGGKLIDWSVVERLFVPILIKRYNLHDFQRGNRERIAAFAKLKMLAEKAKIALSKDSSYEIGDEHICVSDTGEPVLLDVCVSRREVEQLAAPYVLRSMNICRKVLEERHLRPGDISRVILVGGPTLTPYIRQTIADAKEGLGIAVDTSMDPLLVVSQGAAIFAGTQRRLPSLVTPNRGQFNLLLEYKPMSQELEPLVGGKIEGVDQTSFAGYTIRFSNAASRPPWYSGRLPLSPVGKFMTTLRAERGAQNLFAVELYDPAGSICPVRPSTFTYSVSLTVTNPPITHDIGIAMADNKVDVLFRKGDSLPAKAKTTHRTTIALLKSDPETRLRIPIIEGSHVTHADLNRRVGEISIASKEICHDLPEGSLVDISLNLDASRLLTGTAFFTLLDQEFPVCIDGIQKPNPPWEGMRSESEELKKRLIRLSGMARESEQAMAKAELARLKNEDTMTEIGRLLAVGDQQDAKVTCEGRMLELKATLQRVEDALESRTLVAEAEEEIASTRKLLVDGTAEDQARFELLEPEVKTAIHGDIDVLRRKVEEMFGLRIAILARSPQYWMDFRDYLLGRQEQMLDQPKAKLWFAHADRAINSGNTEALSAACRQLWSLLPKEQQARGYEAHTRTART